MDFQLEVAVSSGGQAYRSIRGRPKGVRLGRKNSSSAPRSPEPAKNRSLSHDLASLSVTNRSSWTPQHLPTLSSSYCRLPSAAERTQPMAKTLENSNRYISMLEPNVQLAPILALLRFRCHQYQFSYFSCQHLANAANVVCRVSSAVVNTLESLMCFAPHFTYRLKIDRRCGCPSYSSHHQNLEGEQNP